MTTAHRPTFFNALGGEQQGGNLIVAATTKVSSRDLPGHTTLKTRHIRPPPIYSVEDYLEPEVDAQTQKLELRKRLQIKEKEHQAEKQAEAILSHQPIEASRVPGKVLPASLKFKAESTPYPEDEDDLGPTISADTTVTFKEETDNSSSEMSDGEDEEEATLLRELEKIRNEREQEKIKAEEREERLNRSIQALTSNKLLMSNESKELKRRWDDDVVFKNQAKDLPKPKKRFIDDTLRSDFHRRFLAKYIL